MSNFKIGVQLYSVRGDMEKDFEGTLEKVSKMGYEYVEFAGYFGRSSAEIKALLEKYNLKCISVHQGIDFFNDDPQKGIDYLKGFGVKYVVIPWYDKSKLTGDAWSETAEKFSTLSSLLAKNGMKLLYHNHDFEFEKLPDGRYIHTRIMEEVCGIEPQFDTCWVHYAGINPCEMLEKYSGKVEVVHLKDFVCKNLASGPVYALIDKDGNPEGGKSQAETGFDYRPLGRGVQNMDELLAACQKAGSEYLIVEQDESSDMPPLEAIEISRKFLLSKGI